MRPGAADVAPPPDAAEEATRQPGFCERAGDAALLCDDFDQPLDVPLEARWAGYSGVVPGFLSVGDGAVARGPGPFPALSSPYVVDFTAPATGDLRRSALLIALNEAPANALAFEVSAGIHLSSFDSLGETDAGGEAGATPSDLEVAMLGAGSTFGPDVIGAQLVLSPSSLELMSGVQSDETAGTGRGTVARFEYRQIMLVGWMRFFLVLGERDVAVAHATRATGATPACPATPAVAVAWAELPLARSACIALDARVLPLGGRPLGFVIGPSFKHAANVRVQMDDAVLRVLP